MLDRTMVTTLERFILDQEASYPAADVDYVSTVIAETEGGA